VVEPGEGDRLTVEAAPRLLGLGDALVEDLDRDRAVEAELPGGVEDAPAPLAELLAELEALDGRCAGVAREFLPPSGG